MLSRSAGPDVRFGEPLDHPQVLDGPLTDERTNQEHQAAPGECIWRRREWSQSVGVFRHTVLAFPDVVVGHVDILPAEQGKLRQKVVREARSPGRRVATTLHGSNLSRFRASGKPGAVRQFGFEQVVDGSGERVFALSHSKRNQSQNPADLTFSAVCGAAGAV
jgi:hypothetical protein